MTQDEMIAKYKNVIINAIIIIIAIIISSKIYSAKDLEIKTLEENKGIELKKNETMIGISKLQKEFSKYKKYINKKDSSSILDDLRNLANECSVEIGSISPGQGKESNLFKQLSYDLKLKTSSYHNIGEFIAKLESHNDIFSVESISISVEQAKESAPEIITFDMKINTVLIKDE